jgi:hypothetical protein
MIRYAGMLAALLGSLCPCGALGDDGRKTLHFTADQERVLLEANRITDAAERCDYKIAESAIDHLLRGAAIGETDMEIRSLSTGLRQQVDADRKTFATDKPAACARALAEFGQSGTLGRFLSK